MDRGQMGRRRKMSKILLIGLLAGSAFDVGSTEIALRHPGLHESNPLMTNRGVRITVNIAVPIILYKMIKDKPVKTQLGIAVPYITFKTWAGMHNLKLAKKEER